TKTPGRTAAHEGVGGPVSPATFKPGGKCARQPKSWRQIDHQDAASASLRWLARMGETECCRYRIRNRARPPEIHVRAICFDQGREGNRPGLVDRERYRRES